jgi:Na+/H+ antiporter NhaD/arsenite permease-like protein
VISGGISVEGDLQATPFNNVIFLALGTILANFIGTTGASMLLIRPFLKTNSQRKRTWHLPLFFIFTVSNGGGLLTPLGDPPLFLGFLNGVPFHWTLSLWPEWITAVGTLLVVFFIWDRWAYRLEEAGNLSRDKTEIIPLKIEGGGNFIFLVGIVGAVFLRTPWREMAMIFLSTLSYFSTAKKIHRRNQFTFFPVLEVAILFAGIFITMTPALMLLESKGAELPLTKPWHFFWASGIISSFLDNAPTYLSFFELAKGLHAGGAIAGIPEALLRAISIGSVLMGANTYIGNGPNFMVKAIADEQGFKTLNFGGHLLMSLLILFPIYFLFTWIFF